MADTGYRPRIAARRRCSCSGLLMSAATMPIGYECVVRRWVDHHNETVRELRVQLASRFPLPMPVSYNSRP